MTPETLDCGHPPSPHDESTTGYASNSQGKRYCYECAAEMDRDAIRAGKPITAYLSKAPSDSMYNFEVSTWPGVQLGYAWITSEYPVRNSAWGNEILCIRARLQVGEGLWREYYGRGFGDGMVINLRPCKVKVTT